MILVSSAEPIGNGVKKSVVIEISQYIPELKELDDYRTFYQKQAIMIEEGLRYLPGGTYDALLIEMMKRTVSLFQVPHQTHIDRIMELEEEVLRLKNELKSDRC